jgi:glycosyltransferase
VKVSVVTPVYNGAATIAECIESVQSQEYQNIEHIVIDGGSTDNTIEIVKSYGVLYISEKDTGVYDAFNKGVINTHGDVVHILNADDLYSGKDSVSKVIRHMEANDLDLCHGYVDQFNDYNSKVKRIGKDVTKNELFRKMRVAHPSTFVKRKVYQQYGAFSVGFKVAADQEFLLRVWDEVKVGFIPEGIVNMREGGISTSQFVSSYRESMAASIINGYSPFKAYCVYNYEMMKNIVLAFRK